MLERSIDQSFCPLCLQAETVPFHHDERREYRSCQICRLVYVPERYFLPPEVERQQYDFHENDPSDANYRAFLSRLFDPLVEHVPRGASGLDFGSGPGPTLSVMLIESGRSAIVYDPFYAPDQSVWEKSYDFITATEVFEHLHRPAEELGRIWDHLRPGGWLGIMTKRLPDPGRFPTWHYKNDPTHVAFFADETFRFLANRWRADLQLVRNDVVLMRKQDAAS